MDNEKKCTLAEFSRRALQRMKDKKIPKKQTLHIPSMDAVEPNLREGAKEIMSQEAELPPEERELREPLDIVNMFDLAEITQISEAIMELSGAMNGKVTIVEQLKK